MCNLFIRTVSCSGVLCEIRTEERNGERVEERNGGKGQQRYK